MKNISKLILGLSVILAFSACEKDEERAVIDPKAPSMLTPTDGTTMLLKKEDKDKTIEFKWKVATYGFDASVTYVLEIAKQGTNFASPVGVATVNNKEKADVLIDNFNNQLLGFLSDPETPAALALDLRLKATVNDNVEILYSQVIKLTITPFVAPIVYPMLSVPGSHQGWNPADLTTVVYSAKSDGKYEGYLWFANANTEFKYTSSFSWAVNYGDNGADGTLEPDGANIKAGAAGCYKLNVNMNNLTHTFVRTSWGLIGSATPGGWNTDQAMTYDVTNKVWRVTAALTVGKIKFRANGGWDINLGDDGANGILEYGGADIDVTSAGNYTVTLNLSKALYRYTLVKN